MSALRIADCGVRIIERPAVAALAEMFHLAGGPRPHIAAIWGPRGSGKRVLVAELARVARMRGFVPVASHLVGSRQAALWRGRSLFVIGSGREHAWRAVLEAALGTAQPHVVLLVGEDESRSVDGLACGRLEVEDLVRSIRPDVPSGHVEEAVRRAAERARGLPGRFARLLWPRGKDALGGEPRGRRACLPRVAEQPAIYGDEAAEDPFRVQPPECTWPAPGELAALRRKMEHALADLARGRHAPGVRQLRQAVGGLARRGAWSDAARGALALAAALLRRGRARDVQAVIDDGRDYASRADEESVLVDLAVLSGEAWIDMSRLDEADSVLGATLTVARALGDPERVARASIALARVAYWRGEFAEAGSLLAAAPDAPAVDVRRRLLAVRIAIGQCDPHRAMSLVTSALDAPAGDASAAAAVAWVGALVHVAAGDVGAAERDLSRTLALAAAARDPQRAVRARLLQIELDRCRGRAASAQARLHRLRRVVGMSPAIVRARWSLATALSSSPDDAARTMVQHVRATGLGALGLYTTVERGGTDGAGTIDPFVEELVAILRVCQTAADETELLAGVCVRLRRHLHAAAVGFAGIRGEHAQLLTSDGSRLDAGIAERAASARVAIAPHRLGDWIEAAVPVVYGGAPIGALCARWTIGSTYVVSRAEPVLTMAAAAAAPMVAAVMARPSREGGAADDFLGVTPAILDLRRSVERAAAAPFAVLIDGESGSGKELVARAIHRGSTRSRKAFCTLNCAALPDELVEAELFGHARGAFTGAVADRAGVFEEAHGGTLFLDEIGELTPRAQAKVLRVIQEGELRRVGETVSRRVDVRIVSATNRSLRQEVEGGRFRLDLLYRLDVVHITVPPLRERREDVAVLADRYWRDATLRVGSRAALGAETLAALARYDWPGNVRELQNVLAALAVRSPKRGVVPPSALPPPFHDREAAHAWTLDDARRTFELGFVRAALVRTGGHRGRAAAELGVTRQGLAKLMTRLGIPP